MGGWATGRIVNMVGRGIGSEDAPDENCWGVNIVMLRRKVDLGFDMHRADKMNSMQILRRKEIIKRITCENTPVYSCEAIPDTTYRRYPIERVVTRFPTGFFSNALCYMTALALLEGVEEINYYGCVFLSYQKEYALQKPAVDFWLGVAMGMGVKCRIHGTSEMGKTQDNVAYGYELTAQEMINNFNWYQP